MRVSSGREVVSPEREINYLKLGASRGEKKAQGLFYTRRPGVAEYDKDAPLTESERAAANAKIASQRAVIERLENRLLNSVPEGQVVRERQEVIGLRRKVKNQRKQLRGLHRKVNRLLNLLSLAVKRGGL